MVHTGGPITCAAESSMDHMRWSPTSGFVYPSRAKMAARGLITEKILTSHPNLS